VSPPSVRRRHQLSSPRVHQKEARVVRSLEMQVDRERTAGGTLAAPVSNRQNHCAEVLVSSCVWFSERLRRSGHPNEDPFLRPRADHRGQRAPTCTHGVRAGAAWPRHLRRGTLPRRSTRADGARPRCAIDSDRQAWPRDVLGPLSRLRRLFITERPTSPMRFCPPKPRPRRWSCRVGSRPAWCSGCAPAACGSSTMTGLPH